MTRPTTSRMAAVWMAAAALTLAACLGGDVETKSEKDVNTEVQQHADGVAAVAHQALQNPSLLSRGCTGRAGEISKSVFTVQGVYNLPAPTSETHLELISRVRADWTSKGYEITDDRTVDTDRGVLAAKTPDGYKLDIETGEPSGFAVFVDSPCFERP
ncbi:hypothetical protein [Actinoplanes sp. L3-i22]|uniref:hypothetical protein n=1 Tax=Actinoplanes sp. L3-i22 TaxID=2836373 RepID=UPI001C750A2D|nr:hypothetical protein [Actinoplanes sp. L3-i22]BCY09474.1 hypothetical protein L3i22_045620 [Actinoplanes sp. L3-i22]